MANVKRIQKKLASLGVGVASLDVILPESVELNRSIIMFSERSNCGRNDIASGLVSGQLINSTTIQFVRAQTLATTWIEWQVIEFDSGVSVQRGNTSLTASGATNVVITNVDLTKSFTIFSFRGLGNNDYGRQENVRARLTSATNLELYVHTGTATSVVAWQVITYEHCNVQQITFTIPGNQILYDLPISQVNVNRSFLVGSFWANEGKVHGQRLFNYYFLNPTTIRFERFTTMGNPQEWTLTVIEFEENEARVLNLNAIVGTSDTVIQININEINSEMSVIKINTDNTKSLGRINRNEDDFDHIMFTSKINPLVSSTSSLQVELQRFGSGYSGFVDFQVVEFIPREKRSLLRGLNRGIMRQQILT